MNTNVRTNVLNWLKDVTRLQIVMRMKMRSIVVSLFVVLLIKFSLFRNRFLQLCSVTDCSVILFHNSRFTN